MLLTVFCVPRDRAETTFALEVSPELELRDFVALCELESGIPAGDIQISYAEQPLRDLTRTLENYGLKDGDVVVLRQADRRSAAQPTFPGLPRIDFSSIAVPGTSSDKRSTTPAPQPRAPQTSSAASPASSPQGLDNPTLLRDMLLANPHELSLLKERNPPLAEALLSGDLERFTKVLLEQQQDRAKREQERIRLFTADPFDLEAQAKIEEDIRQHNIEENMTIAMEEAPESFGQVVMLYINCKVNGHPVKAFVDSGAQMTIMSQACAERCNIMRLVDRRWAGIAKGVGTQKIIGRVHLAQVQIEGDFLPCSFSILEDQPMDMLLGLDMLKRHQCSIDLKKSVLLIGTTGTETRFLPEAELPDCARLAYGPEGREDTRPEEIADRELAEALQRSVQDSDTADGTTTSPQPPTLATSSSAPSPSRSFTLDRSKSAPASIHKSLPPETSFGMSQTQGETKPHSSYMQSVIANHPPDVQQPAPTIDESLQSHPNDQAYDFNSQPVADSTMPNSQATEDYFPHVFPTQEPCSSTVSKDNEETRLVPDGKSLNEVAGGEDIVLQEAESTESPFTHFEACIQEVDMAESGDPKMASPDIPDQFQENEQVNIMKNAAVSQGGQLSSLTMHYNLPGLAASSEQNLIHSEFEKNEASPVAKTAMNSEKDQSECDNIPSLAQALKELHNLLMSNTQACGRNTPSESYSTTSPDNDGVDQAVTTVDYARLCPIADSSSHTGPANEATFATSKTETLSDDGKVKIMTVLSQGQEAKCVNQFTNSIVEEDRPPCSDFSEGNQGGDNARGPVSEPEETTPLHSHQAEENEASLTVYNPPELVYNPLDTADPIPQHLFSEEHGSTADSPNLLPVDFTPPSVQDHEVVPHPTVESIQLSTVPLIGQYPAEHIQRIQAAGFSSHEAAEALEQADGSVELALLMLLARKITVPT